MHDLQLSTLLPLWSHVWTFRKEHADKWFAPTPEQCILYAISEFGEYYDAICWQQRPEDARANQRERVPNIELADTIIMLISAFPTQELFEMPFVHTDKSATIVGGLRQLAYTQQLIEDKKDEAIWKQWAFLVLRIIVTNLGDEQSQVLVAEKLQKIRTKVLGR
jgi:hypothetical protein